MRRPTQQSDASKNKVITDLVDSKSGFLDKPRPGKAPVRVAAKTAAAAKHEMLRSTFDAHKYTPVREGKIKAEEVEKMAMLAMKDKAPEVASDHYLTASRSHFKPQVLKGWSSHQKENFAKPSEKKQEFLASHFIMGTGKNT